MTRSKNVGGYDFPIANLLGYVSVTKIRVHSFIDAENLRRTTLHRTDIYRNLSLGAPKARFNFPKLAEFSASKNKGCKKPFFVLLISDRNKKYEKSHCMECFRSLQAMKSLAQLYQQRNDGKAGSTQP